MSTKETIEIKIHRQLNPVLLSVENESHLHNVPADSETHYKVLVVAEAFDGKRQVQRHQLIYRIVSEELSAGVHALALHTYTPGEWHKKQTLRESPPCLGGGESSK